MSQSIKAAPKKLPITSPNRSTPQKQKPLQKQPSSASKLTSPLPPKLKMGESTPQSQDVELFRPQDTSTSHLFPQSVQQEPLPSSIQEKQETKENTSSPRTPKIENKPFQTQASSTSEFLASPLQHQKTPTKRFMIVKANTPQPYGPSALLTSPVQQHQTPTKRFVVVRGNTPQPYGSKIEDEPLQTALHTSEPLVTSPAQQQKASEDNLKRKSLDHSFSPKKQKVSHSDFLSPEVEDLQAQDSRKKIVNSNRYIQKHLDNLADQYFQELSEKRLEEDNGQVIDEDEIEKITEFHHNRKKSLIDKSYYFVENLEDKAVQNLIDTGVIDTPQALFLNPTQVAILKKETVISAINTGKLTVNDLQTGTCNAFTIQVLDMLIIQKAVEDGTLTAKQVLDAKVNCHTKGALESSFILNLRAQNKLRLIDVINLEGHQIETLNHSTIQEKLSRGEMTLDQVLKNSSDFVLIYPEDN